jgi:hypothetical protein
MEKQKEGTLPSSPSQTRWMVESVRPQENGYDGCSEKKTIESTVIWIGKDSESESNEYLEECNTHQSGE